MSQQADIVIFEDGDGVLVFGDEKSLSTLDDRPGVVSLSLPPHALTKVGQALSTVGEVQANSGRWLKMTKESKAAVDTLGPSLARSDKLVTGVVRGDKGRIVKHLKFENVGLLTPAAPAMRGAIATQMALDSALDEITAYLAAIDAKLDRLLKQRKTETLGQLGGVTFTIDEAKQILEETGTVSQTTWSKVQTNSIALATMQSEAIAQLASLAEDIHDAGDDPERLVDATTTAKGDTPFWLGILARTMALENKQYILELARLAEANAAELDDHRRGIGVARRERLSKISRSLVAIEASLQRVSDLPNLRKVTNPFKVARIVGNVNDVNRDIAAFAVKVELEGVGTSELPTTRWGAAVRQMIGDGADVATGAVRQVGDQARALSQQIADARDEATLRKAEEVTERRKARLALHAEDSPESGAPDTHLS